MITNQSQGLNNSFLALQPAWAWTLILGFTILTAALVVGGAGKVLNLIFPAGALVIAVLLYYHTPQLYVGFMWWMWFLTAFVRRIADYFSSFTEPSPLLLTPYLVSCVALITLFKFLPKPRDGTPFVLGTIGVLYGFVIALIVKSPFIAFRGLIDWISPIAIGFYFFQNWKDYPKMRQTTERVFVWGVLLMGVYGVWQFVSLPEWDRNWLIDSNFIGAAGDPDKEAPRIWSTMNSGEPFAAFMAGALLFLLNSKNKLIVPASAVGYLSFLLAMVRSAWLGWLGGLIALVGFLKPKFQIRLISTILILALCVVPLATMEPFAERISNRVETLSDVSNDDSAKGRQQMFRESIDKALTSFIGEGIENSSMDNGFLAMLFYLGWLGTIPYFGGMLILIINLFKLVGQIPETFAGTCLAVTIASLVRFPVNGAQLGISGVMLWGFLGLGLATCKYYNYQLKYLSQQSKQ